MILKSHNIKCFVVFTAGLAVSYLPLPLVYAQNAVPAPAHSDAPVDEDKATVTLDFKDADINTVLRVMSLKSGVNIVAGPEVQGTVTIRLEDVPWKKALEVVLRTYGYVFERDGNIIRVTTRENLAAEPLVTKTFILNYSKAAEVMDSIKDMLTERGRIKVAERTNMLVVTDIPTNLYTIEEVILKLDKITAQAYIDSKVVKTDAGAAENLGVEWKTGGDTSTDVVNISGSQRPTAFPFVLDPGGGAGETIGGFFQQFFPTTAAGSTTTGNTADLRSFPNPGVSTTNVTGGNYQFGTLDFSNFSAVLQFLRTRSSTKVVSNPRIVVLNNQEAKIQVGSDIPLPTFERNETTGSVEISGFYYREIGVVLNVTPHINSEEEILVDLKPEVSSQGANVDFGEFQIPSFNVTKALTQVLIRSGETIAIGGLLTDNVTTNESRVPFFSDIPFVGKIFRSKRQSAGDSNKKVETLFFVTVTMVDSEGQPAGERAEAKDRLQAPGAAPKGDADDASAGPGDTEASIAGAKAAPGMEMSKQTSGADGSASSAPAAA